MAPPWQPAIVLPERVRTRPRKAAATKFRSTSQRIEDSGVDWSLVQFPEGDVPTEKMNAADIEETWKTKFDDVLDLLQKAHVRELAQMETQLKATQQELARVKRDVPQDEEVDCSKVTLEMPLQDAQYENGPRCGEGVKQVVASIDNHSPASSELWQEEIESPVNDQKLVDPKFQSFNDSVVDAKLAREDTEQLDTDDQKAYKKFEANELAVLKGWIEKPKKHHTRMQSIEQLETIPIVHSWWRAKLIDMLGWKSWDMFCAIAIVSNSLIMGAQIDYVSRNMANPADPPYRWRVIDRVYTCWFVFELLLRLLAYGCHFFFMPGWGWNCFDVLVVTTDGVQTIIEVVTRGQAGLAKLSFLRMLRVLRVTRAIRVVRLVRFFKELRIMVNSVMKSGTSLMWSILMFGVIIYIFAILLLNTVADFIFDNMTDEYYLNYRKYWSSLPQGMWTLFSCMTGGVSWMEVGDALIHIGWSYGGLLGFFMFFTLFVVTNIITGIFVDTAIQSAQSDKDEVIQEELHNRDSARIQLKEIFEEADEDGSGTLTQQELEHHLADQQVRAHFKSIGLMVEEARALYRLIDIHRTNVISIEEFLFGCMRLKGGATSIDMATLLYENRRLVEGLQKFHHDVVRSIRIVDEKIDHHETFFQHAYQQAISLQSAWPAKPAPTAQSWKRQGVQCQAAAAPNGHHTTAVSMPRLSSSI